MKDGGVMTGYEMGILEMLDGRGSHLCETHDCRNYITTWAQHGLPLLVNGKNMPFNHLLMIPMSLCSSSLIFLPVSLSMSHIFSFLPHLFVCGKNLNAARV